MRNAFSIYLTLLAAGVAAGAEPAQLFTGCTRETVIGRLPEATTGIKVVSSIATEEGVCFKVAGTLDGKAIAGAIFDQSHPLAVAYRLEIQQPPAPPPAAPAQKATALAASPGPSAPLGQVVNFSGADFYTGERFTLGSLKSKAILVHFWKSAADKTAQEDAEYLSHLKAQFGSQGLEIVGVTAERSYDRVRAFNDNAEAVWPLVQDRKGLAEKYGVSGPSEILLLDGHRTVISAGPRPSGLEQLVSQQLKTRQ